MNAINLRQQGQAMRFPRCPIPTPTLALFALSFPDPMVVSHALFPVPVPLKQQLKTIHLHAQNIIIIQVIICVAPARVGTTLAVAVCRL